VRGGPPARRAPPGGPLNFATWGLRKLDFLTSRPRLITQSAIYPLLYRTLTQGGLIYRREGEQGTGSFLQDKIEKKYKSVERGTSEPARHIRSQVPLTADLIPYPYDSISLIAGAMGLNQCSGSERFGLPYPDP
jgi:hypothetical protein